MKCVKCGDSTKVIDSRSTTPDVVRRRRKCEKCMHRFTTYELAPTKTLERLLKDLRNDLWRIDEHLARIIDT